jgi:hypothetical protein
MSDSGIELAMEQDDKARHPRLALYVDGSLKRVEIETEASRRRIEKAAFEALVHSDDVKVVPIRPGIRVGAGEGTAIGRETYRRAGSVGDRRPWSVPLRPASSRASGCCVPEVYAGPSGVRRRHAWNCETAPGEVFEGVVLDIKRARLSAQHRAETLHRGLDEAIADHPASGVLTATDEFCPVHRSEPADDCLTCSNRRL